MRKNWLAWPGAYRHLEALRRACPELAEGIWIIAADDGLGMTRIGQNLGCSRELRVKGKSGILESMPIRRAFVEDPTHRIRFVYTPRHASWLNQVEIWFSEYFNNTMVKVFRWTFKDKPLTI